MADKLFFKELNLGDHFDGRIPIKKLHSFSGETAWKTVFLFLVLILAYSTNLYLSMSELAPLWISLPLQCLIVYGFFTPVHESVHENIGGKRKKLRILDTVIGNISATVMLSPLFAFRYIHLTHHQKVNQKNLDPDFWVASQSLWKAAFKSLFVIPHYLLVYLKADKAVYKKIFAPLVVIAILASVLALSLKGSTQTFLLMTIIPGWLGGALSVLLFDWVPHHPHTEQRPFYHTRNFPQKALDYPMFFQNLHQIHHLNPRIPFYKYRASMDALMGQAPTLAESNSRFQNTTNASQ